jgi:hypothetical protein
MSLPHTAVFTCLVQPSNGEIQSIPHTLIRVSTRYFFRVQSLKTNKFLMKLKKIPLFRVPSGENPAYYQYLSNAASGIKPGSGAIGDDRRHSVQGYPKILPTTGQLSYKY